MYHSLPLSQDCRLDRYDPKLEEVLKSRRRLGRYMPSMQVIPPGLDFSSLKVDLPEDPAIKEMEAMKPAFNARTTLSPSTSSASVQALENGKGKLRPAISLEAFYCMMSI